MKYFAVLLFALCSQATAANLRAIAPLLRPWQEWAEFRVRTGIFINGKRPTEKQLGLAVLGSFVEPKTVLVHHPRGFRLQDMVL